MAPLQRFVLLRTLDNCVQATQQPFWISELMGRMNTMIASPPYPTDIELIGLLGKRVPGLVQPHHFLHIIRNSKNRLQEKTDFEQEQVRTEDQRHKMLLAKTGLFPSKSFEVLKNIHHYCQLTTKEKRKEALMLDPLIVR
ncbi:hypothetical protein GQ457_06G025220 [Hibiscus cannabinus]